MKKIISVLVALTMTMSLISPAFAAERRNISEADQHAAQNEMINVYLDALRSSGGDSTYAMTELLNSSDSLKIVSSMVSPNTEVEQNDMIFRDEYIVYDSDWETYVYFGSWYWRVGVPDDTGPWDVAGVISQDVNDIKILDLITTLYTITGIEAGYCDTSTGECDGALALVPASRSAAAIWIEPGQYVKKGSFIAPLEVDDPDTTAKVSMEYIHSYAETEITGLGGSISLSDESVTISGSISWNTGIYDWNTGSGGARIE